MTCPPNQKVPDPKRTGTPTPDPSETEIAGARLFSTGSRAFAVLVAGAVIGFGVQLGTVRLIGAESFGTYVYVIAWVTVLAYVATLGFHTSLLRLLPAYRVSSDWARAHGAMRFAFRSASLTGAAVAVLAIGATLLAHGAEDELARALLVGALAVPLMTLRLVGAAAVRAFGGVIMSMLPERILRDSFTFAILAVLVLGGFAPPDAVSAMVAALAAAILALLFIRHFLAARRPAELASAVPLYARRDWLRPALPLTLIMLADTLMSRAGVLILGLRGDTLEAGIYAVAFSLALLSALPRMALSALFAPTVSAFYARGDMVGLQRLVARSAVLSLAATFVVAVPLIAGAPVLLPWFGPQFLAAAPVLAVLVVGQLASAAAGPQQHLLTMTGHERQGAVLMASAAAGAVVGGALLCIPFGMMGVAAAATLSMIGWNVGMAVFLMRRLGLRPGLACWGNPGQAAASAFSRWGKAVWKPKGQS
ncbi:lipopolysaccharide biosynthesis protein [Puniceibacterium confluentis]|uniref:lipopolysaccharide biosynthesis protein n=1 Tax=Puniceibacterium confluentis TaxID=1958944 RepID=UPI0011B397BF|nr:oligosaccharide flippase family protein [Puniceibacterium confluentis]